MPRRVVERLPFAGRLARLRAPAPGETRQPPAYGRHATLAPPVIGLFMALYGVALLTTPRPKANIPLYDLLFGLVPQWAYGVVFLVVGLLAAIFPSWLAVGALTFVTGFYALMIFWAGWFYAGGTGVARWAWIYPATPPTILVISFRRGVRGAKRPPPNQPAAQ